MIILVTLLILIIWTLGSILWVLARTIDKCFSRNTSKVSTLEKLLAAPAYLIDKLLA